MNLFDIGKNVKTFNLDFAVGDKIIPRGSIGTVVGHYYEFDIHWIINGETVATSIPYSKLSAMEKTGILKVLEVSEPKDTNSKTRLYKKGDIVCVDRVAHYLVVSEGVWNIAKCEFEYTLWDLDYLFIGNYTHETYCESELVGVDKVEFELDYASKRYVKIVKEVL